jgi:Uma2 family endonuclease
VRRIGEKNAMSTQEHATSPELNLGRDDEGRLVSAEEFATATFDEPWKYEREDGRLVVLAPNNWHQVRTIGPWLDALVLYSLSHPDVIEEVVPNAWVRVDEGTERIGDIGVYLVQDPRRFELPDQPPDLMVEIVTAGRDSNLTVCGTKRNDYYRVGVREYVIVDRILRKVIVLTHASDGYRERVLNTTDTYATPLLPALGIPIAKVFSEGSE